MLFINNKYTKWYYQIINSAKQNPHCGYTEKHHIIPKSLGGDNSKENLVRLSARQHYICHVLLVKMTEARYKSKMGYALLWFRSKGNSSSRDHIFNSWTYVLLKGNLRTSEDFTDEWRKKISMRAKERFSNPENNIMFNKKHSIESKIKMSENSKGNIAWNKGKPRTSIEKENIRNALIGKRWVNNQGQRKYLSPLEAEQHILNGWTYGIGPRQ